MAGITLGNVFGMAVATLPLDVTSVAANTTAERTLTVPGVRLGDMVFVNKPTLSAGLGICNARVSAVDTVAITFNNNTASPIDPASETYTVLVIRPDAGARASVAF
jgi:hypothetical protein